jgi:nicotinamidase-related amidase
LAGKLDVVVYDLCINIGIDLWIFITGISVFKMYTLVVVDMQYEFFAARNEKTQAACKKAIAKAIKSKYPIVFLEYVDRGPTLPSLTKLTRNYSKAFHVSKSEWDGSSETLRVLTNNKISSSKFKICGVYTECCVSATAIGLADRLSSSKIEVLEKACWATNEYLHSEGLHKMSSYKNRIRVVK